MLISYGKYVDYAIKSLIEFPLMQTFARELKSSYFLFFVFTSLLLLFLHFTMTNNLLHMFTIHPITRFSIDPFVYTAYAHNYTDVMERCARPYSAARLAFIYPARMMTWLFGGEAGYMVLRNLFLVGAIGAIWKMCIHFFQSKKMAVFTSLVVVLHPWFLRALFWNYVDGIAVVYMLIAISFVVANKEESMSYFISGIFSALAINCQLLTLTVLAAFIPSWLLLHRTFSFYSILFFLLGFLFIYFAFVIGTYIEFPSINPFFEPDVLNITKYLFSGGCIKWMMSLQTLVSEGRYYLLYPLFLLTVAIFFFIKQQRESTLGQAAILYLTSVVFVYSLLHFVFQISVLSFLYYSYVMVATFFIFIWLIGETIQSSNKIMAISAGAYCLIWILAPFYIDGIGHVSGLFFAAAAALLLCGIFLLKCPRILVLLTLILSPFVFYRDGIYASLHTSGRNDWDVYRGAVFLQELISSELDTKSKIGFWYSNSNERPELNSIQSMFLWLYTRLCDDTQNAEGMPIVDDYFRKQVDKYPYIALLAYTEPEIKEGVKALEKEGIFISEVVRKEFHSDRFNYHILLLKKERSL